MNLDKCAYDANHPRVSTLLWVCVCVVVESDEEAQCEKVPKIQQIRQTCKFVT